MSEGDNTSVLPAGSAGGQLRGRTRPMSGVAVRQPDRPRVEMAAGESENRGEAATAAAAAFATGSPREAIV